MVEFILVLGILSLFLFCKTKTTGSAGGYKKL